MSSELTAAERVNLLEQMQKQDANRRRNTVFAAWGSVGLATLVLALLVFGAGSQLRKIREEQEREAAKLKVITNEKVAKQTELDRVNTELKEKEARLGAATKLLGIGGEQPLEKQLAADPNAAKLLPRAYLQIVDKDDRDWANTMRSRLEEAGIIVPGVELVTEAANLKSTEVRYYKEAEKEGADKIVAILKVAGVDAHAKNIHQENNRRVRPNHFEVWFVAGSRNIR